MFSLEDKTHMVVPLPRDSPVSKDCAPAVFSMHCLCAEAFSEVCMHRLASALEAKATQHAQVALLLCHSS